MTCRGLQPAATPDQRPRSQCVREAAAVVVAARQKPRGSSSPAETLLSPLPAGQPYTSNSIIGTGREPWDKEVLYGKSAQSPGQSKARQGVHRRFLYCQPFCAYQRCFDYFRGRLQHFRSDCRSAPRPRLHAQLACSRPKETFSSLYR